MRVIVASLTLAVFRTMTRAAEGPIPSEQIFRVSFVFLWSLVASESLAARYSVTPIAPANSAATAINTWGDIVGVFRTESGVDHAFLYAQDFGSQYVKGFVDLGTLSGGYSIPRDINDSREIVGQSDGRAFVYYAGDGPFNPGYTSGMFALDSRPSDARRINDSGRVIGTVYREFRGTTTFWDVNPFYGSRLYAQSFVTEDTEGYGITISNNNVGRVDRTTGYYSSDTGISSYTDLGLFLPNAISNSGMVAGSENGIAGYYNSSRGTFLSFGLLDPKHVMSDAVNVNDQNKFVGFSRNSSESRGFLWDEVNGFTDLTEHLAPGFEDWTVLSANDISSKYITANKIYGDWIAAQVRYQGNDYAAILRPVAVPEASSIILVSSVAFAIGLMTFYSSRRSRQYS